ncbi:kelch-like protein 3 [Paramacrobiotus metropolitanus]|uniref:kelch-like protein 3 n=1 Tax=Paramacrobiotus metropolitanus TaxID=2943436 RepID=UPI002445EC7A|nr:kelch-like protein 3 [Paramacrobiotus metropolitanus]
MENQPENVGKRKAEDAGSSTIKIICTKPDADRDRSVSGGGGEPRASSSSSSQQLVAVVTGQFTVYSPWSAVEALGQPWRRQDNQCHLRLPANIDPWSAHLVLQAALHPRLPLDAGRANRDGAGTARQLQEAAAFLRIPLPSTLNAAENTPKTVVNKTVVNKRVQTTTPQATVPKPSSASASESVNQNRVPADSTLIGARLSLSELLAVIRQDFLPLSNEMEVYQKVMNWFHVDYPARWTSENFKAVMPEIRWDLLPEVLPVAILTAAGPLRDALLELETCVFPPAAVRYTAAPRERIFTEVACLFSADRHTASLRLYDMRQNKLLAIPLPAELQTWNTMKEMGPVVGNRVWFRVEHGAQLRTYALAIEGTDASKMSLEQLCEEPLTGAASPLVSLNGRVYGWNTGATRNTASYAFDPVTRQFDRDIQNPKQMRKEAGFDVWQEGPHHYFIICGGYPAKGRQCNILATGDIYNAGTNQWSELPAMREARCSFAAKVHNGYLYVTGGVGRDSTVLSSCERLQLGVAGAQWQPLPGLTVPRYGHSMFVLKDKLFVCGGCCRDGMELTSMEVYTVAAHRRSMGYPVGARGARSSPVSACVTLTVNNKALP